MNGDLVRALSFTVPTFFALLCMVLVLMDMRGKPRKSKSEERNLHSILVLTFFVAALCWFGLVLYMTDHGAFTLYYPLFLLMLMLDQVLLYRFVHIVTATDNRRGMPWRHYIFPALLFSVAVVSAIVVPLERQTEIIFGAHAGDGGWFETLYGITTIVFIVYNSLYPALALRRIRRYRREVEDYSAESDRSSLRWLAIMQALTLVMVPVPLAGLLFGMNAFTQLPFVLLGALPASVTYLLLCYNMLSDNYIIIQSSEPEETAGQGAPLKRIDRQRFEIYMRQHKPWLDPHLRITDLCDALGTNRSYLSSLINSEYGMNFSRYINLRRLEELDRIRLDPKNEHALGMKMVLDAGFGSYRSYLRVKADEDARKVVREFD